MFTTLLRKQQCIKLTQRFCKVVAFAPKRKFKNAIKNSAKYKIWLALLGLAGASALLIAMSRNGAGISPDSVIYISTARNIANGRGFVTYVDAPLVLQPPSYPAILGFIALIFGVDPLLSAPIINAILFGFTLYLSGTLLLEHLKSFPFLALIGTISLLVSIPLITVFLMAWSEPLFIFFLVVYLTSMSTYMKRKDIKSLLLLSLSTTLACLTRYIGVVLIATGILGTFLIWQGNIKTKYVHTVIFTSVSILPLAMWIGRNYVLSGTFFGPRSPSLHPLQDNIGYTFSTILHWYLPSLILHNPPLLLLLIIIIGSFTGIVFAIAKIPFRVSFQHRTYPFIVFTIFFIIGYTGFLIISSTTTNYDPIGDRLLSPIVVPVTLLLFSVVTTFARLLKARFTARVVDLAIIAGSTLWLIYPTCATGINIMHHFSEGTGYSARTWKSNQTIQYIRQNTLSDCTIYTNGSDVIYLLLSMNVKSIPSKSSGAQTLADVSPLKGRFPQEGKACIIWFDQITWRNYLFTPSELLSVTNVERVINLGDGTLYFVSRK